MNVKITIKAETLIPNTMDMAAQDIVFHRTLETEDHERLLVEAYREVELALELLIKSELEKRSLENNLDFHI
jgi:hypothetical protein